MPLFWLSLAFLCGLILGNTLEWSWQAWLAATVGSTALIPVFWKIYRSRSSAQAPPLQNTPGKVSFYLPKPGMILVVLPAVFFGGALRYQLSRPTFDSQSIAYYNNRGVLTITGLVTAEPDEYSTFTYLRIQVQKISPGLEAGQSGVTPIQTSQTAGGILLARVLAGQNWHYGDQVELTGSPVTPPESNEFSFKEYLARQGIYAYLAYPHISLLANGQGSPFWAWLYSFKEKMLSLLFKIFPQPESALLAGILIGEDNQISPGLEQAFRTTGTAHIIAISGFNMAVLAGLFTTLFSRLLGVRWGALVAGLGIAFYTLLVGANPAVVRAAIMGCLGLLASQVGRRQTGLNSLAITALVMVLFNPNLPWDVSFQLSFMATLGLILYAQPLQQAFIHLANRWLPAGRVQQLSGPVGEFFLFTLAAQVLTFPIIAYQFRNFSLVSLLANPLVLPVQPLVMELGGLALLGGLIHPVVGQLLAYLAWPFVTYTIRMVEGLGSIPGGLLGLSQTSPWIWFGFYALLFGMTFLGYSTLANGFKQIRAILTPKFGLSLCAILTILVWMGVTSAPNGLLELILFEDGPPGTLLVRTPTGRSVLISGGSYTSQLSQQIGERLPLFHRDLDFWIVAPAGIQNLTNLTLGLGEFSIRQVLWAGEGSPGKAGLSLQQDISDEGIPLNLAEPGQVLNLGGGASLRVLTITPSGTVLLLEWNSFRALLPVGTLEDQGEILTAASAITGPVTVLLLEGSGTTISNPPEVVEALRPQLILVNPDLSGCPANCPTVLSLSGYNLLRTDQNGWIEISTDGDKMWISIEKEG